MASPMRRLALVILVVVTACAAEQPQAQPVVQKPTRVLVRDFSVDASQVVLDGNTRAAGREDEARVGDAKAAQETLSRTLIYRLQQMGWVVSRAEMASPPQPGDLVLDGTINRVEEGNRAQLASGGGNPVVAGDARLIAPVTENPPVVVATVGATSSDADVPGMAGAQAAKAAALGSGGQRSRQLLRAGVSAEARRLGNLLADNIQKVFAEKGWEPPSK